MGKVNLENISPGMVLGKDVKERSGRVLLRAGTEISDRHMNILKTWGVTEVDVENLTQQEVNAQVTQQLDPAALKIAEEQVSYLFSHTDKEHPAMRELMRISVMKQVRNQR
jgi:hypothetical protein